MSGARENTGPGTVADAAALWFARLQDEAATHEDWLAFEAWLSEAPEHGEAYDRLERIWVDLDGQGDAIAAALDAPAPASASVVSLDSRRRPAPPRRAWLAMGGALAAGLAVAVTGVATWDSAPTTVYQTRPGETRQIALADGTKIWLNAGSRLEVRLGRRARTVTMADAEAVFEVAHDARRPFVINAGDREFRDVGTAFNLRRRDGVIVLNVRSGAVEARPLGATDAAGVRIGPGQRLSHREGSKVQDLTAGSADPAFAWTQGQLVYEAAPLRVVAADLSRSLGEPVQVADAATGELRFSGVLTLDDRAALLARLEAFAPVRAERGPGGVVIQRR